MSGQGEKLFLHYVWVLELTKRGRPHYHVLFWLPKGVSMPKADKQGWWKHGMTRSEWAHSPVGYLCKYTSKGIDFDSWGKLPRGGRLYGHGGYTPAMRITRAWRVAPAWVRELIDEMDGVKRLVVIGSIGFQVWVFVPLLPLTMLVVF